jgi:predicted Zn-dependent protease
LASFLSEHFRTAEEASSVASNLMDAGLLPLAREVVAYHRRRRAPVDEWYAGQLALAEGRIDEAIRRLTIASKLFPGTSSQGLKIARQLADAHHAAGRLDQAVRLLENATRHPVELIHGWEWLRTRDRLSELYRLAGRSVEAEAVDRQLATLLAVADDDHFIKRRLAHSGRGH